MQSWVVMLMFFVAAIVEVEAQLKDIVQNLYNLIVQAYDHHGSTTQDAMKREMCVQNTIS
jgi:mediator of RNA polymerase II transcription subunit 10